MARENIDREGFAARWSRRKLEQDSGVAHGGDGEAEARAELQESRELEKLQQRKKKLEERDALTDADMPDLSTLDEHSDYSQFMSVNVSEGLRKLALRKLFQGADYNVRDGLDEYDGDYTFFEKLDPGTVTADMRHRMELEEERRKLEKDEETLEESTAGQGDAADVSKQEDRCTVIEDDSTEDRGIETEAPAAEEVEAESHTIQPLTEEETL